MLPKGSLFQLKGHPREKRSRLTLKKFKTRDGGKTIEVRTGLIEGESVYVLSLPEKHPEGLKYGRKLLDLDIRLVILLEWLRHGETYKELAFSFKITNSQVQTLTTPL